MHRIEKHAEPVSMTAWKDQHRTDPNFGYDLFRKSPAADEALGCLVAEQFHLCAYTGIRIAPETAHFEHIKPQTRSKQENLPEETVTWTNLLACYPQPNSPRQPFGAHEKEDWPKAGQDHLFVSPLQDDCEGRFTFDFNGRIQPSSQDDQAAIETIRQLGLDHGAQSVTGLTGLRASAARGILKELQKPVQPLNKTQIAAKAHRMLAAMESRTDGKLPEFCFVKKQVIMTFLKTIQPDG